ncbi:MAG: SagB/ThcOx family dehydrogenase [Candidatus Marinimicrobia bacterium]|nr:SagB/ThcOx family dehydrogenase [Candidatus Neomarinimicrobiota bacterium]
MLSSKLSIILVSFLTFSITLGGDRLKLPYPNYKGGVSLEEAIYKRRSIRDFSEKKLTLEQISQLLWAAQGITDNRYGFRTAPSAGATYPFDVYIIVDRVDKLDSGIYRYIPQDHLLENIEKGRFNKILADFALGQDAIAQAPVNILLSAVYERTTSRYGKRGIMYVHIEAGHIAQNIHLQAVTLGLGSVPIGAFYPEKIKSRFNLPGEPLYIIPVGYPER